MASSIKSRLGCLLICLGAASAQATPVGAYMGIDAGYGIAYYTASNMNLTSATVSRGGMAARAYIGRQINQFLGFEWGYTQLSYIKARNVNGSDGTTLRIAQNAIDMELKALAQMKYNIDLFAKAGVAYVSEVGESSNQNVVTNSSSFQYIPTYGAGIAYEVTPKMPIDFTWSHINGSGQIQASDFYGVGVSYYFG